MDKSLVHLNDAIELLQRREAKSMFAAKLRYAEAAAFLRELSSCLIQTATEGMGMLSVWDRMLAELGLLEKYVSQVRIAPVVHLDTLTSMYSFILLVRPFRSSAKTAGHCWSRADEICAGCESRPLGDPGHRERDPGRPRHERHQHLPRGSGHDTLHHNGGLPLGNRVISLRIQQHQMACSCRPAVRQDPA